MNVMLYDTAINIKGELTEDALIGVSVLNSQYYPYAVTSALDGNASEHTFISDSDDVFTDYNSAEDRIDLNIPFTLNFIANGGSGEMANEVIKDKNYYIPGCGFTAPEGMAFKCWLIDGEEYYPGDPYTVTYHQAANAYFG